MVDMMLSEINTKSTYQMYIFIAYSAIAFAFGVVGLLLNGNIPPTEEEARARAARAAAETVRAAGEDAQLLQQGGASASSSPQDGAQ